MKKDDVSIFFIALSFSSVHPGDPQQREAFLESGGETPQSVAVKKGRESSWEITVGAGGHLTLPEEVVVRRCRQDSTLQ